MIFASLFLFSNNSLIVNKIEKMQQKNQNYFWFRLLEHTRRLLEEQDIFKNLNDLDVDKFIKM